MKHLTEEQLILHYYRDLADTAAVEAHLALCDECRRHHEDLRATLDTVEAPSLPQRSESYGTEVWTRLRPRLEKPPRMDWMVLLQSRRLVALGTVAALVVVAFLAGRFWPRPEVSPPQVISAKAQDRIFLLAVGEHLDRSQRVLLELLNTPSDEPVNITAEQQRVEDLVAANRIYRQTATRAGEPGIANVLDDLERVLLEIARGPSELSAADLKEVRQRIENQGILFKVRVTDSTVHERERISVPGAGTVTGKI
ncbi:MAG: hypothetical protein LAO21_11225 [Acidobacteriia bacterium]|nr:hypothetical protein [Terriglobia bacterium]